MTKTSTWIAKVAVDARISRDAVRVAAAIATDRLADTDTLATRLELAPCEVEEATSALVSAGHLRTRFEPIFPITTAALTSTSRSLSTAARRALAVLTTLGDACHVDTWRRAFHDEMAEADPAARRQAWRRARRALVAAGLVEIDRDGVVTTHSDSAAELT